MGLYWGYIGVILGLYWGYIGVILEARPTASILVLLLLKVRVVLIVKSW